MGSAPAAPTTRRAARAAHAARAGKDPRAGRGAGAPRAGRDAAGSSGAGAARARSAAGGGGRITSLDAVRGVMLTWSVTSDSLLDPPPWYDHARWLGVHPVDVVFPVFVTLSGCGLAFAYRRRIAVVPMLRRAAVLLAFGLLYNLALTLVTTGWTGWSTFRVTGVLQLYAVVVLLMALGHLLTRTARGWLVVTGVLALAHAAALAAWAATCPGGSLTPACNPSRVVDAALLGAGHLYAQGAQGHDPEGVVAVAGALVCAAAGAAAGHTMLGARARVGPGRPGAAVPAMLALAGTLALAGAALAQAVPVGKRLWTSPFALLVASVVVLALLAGHLVLDRARPGAGAGTRGAAPGAGGMLGAGGVPGTPGPARTASASPVDVVAWPLLALGRNSLLVYFGSHALVVVITHVRAPWVAPAADAPSFAAAASQALAVGGHPQLTWSVVTLAAWWALACVLHRFGVYLRP